GMGVYDRSSKWLIEHHGDAILRLAGITEIVSWRAVHSEVVQTGQLPDGAIEATLAGHEEPDFFVLEVATYPGRRQIDQLVRDTTLVFLNKRQLPEVVVLILRPKGRLQVPNVVSIQSRRGCTELAIRWRRVEIWKVPARDLLATGDPGLAPW